MPLTIDTRQFSQALREYKSATKKDSADILNRAAKNVCLRAIAFTPKASAAMIRSLDPKIIAAYVAKGARNKGIKLTRGRNAVQRDARGHFLKGSNARIAGQIGRQEFAEMVRRERARRIRSVGYIAAGWIKAAQAFGGAQGRKVSDRGFAGKGYGKKANAVKLSAFIANLATGADIVGKKALQDALNFVAYDMRVYALKVMARTAARSSAK